MFLLDSLLINGIRFALEKVAQVVDQELDNPERLQERLLEAQMQLEEGTIDEAAFAAIERDVFARMREMKGEAGGGIADAQAFDDVEVEIASDDTAARWRGAPRGRAHARLRLAAVAGQPSARALARLGPLPGGGARLGSSTSTASSRSSSPTSGRTSTTAKAIEQRLSDLDWVGAVRRRASCRCGRAVRNASRRSAPAVHAFRERDDGPARLCGRCAAAHPQGVRAPAGPPGVRAARGRPDASRYRRGALAAPSAHPSDGGRRSRLSARRRRRRGVKPPNATPA